MNIAVFASGNGSNFNSILNFFKAHTEVNVSLFVTNKINCGAVEIARKNNVEIFHYSKFAFPGIDIHEYPLRLISFLKEKKISLIALAGYMKIIEPIIVENFRDKILNVHPALLPAFGGKGMYGENVQVAVLESGVKVSGITVHFVNENYDEGEIIFQKSFDVDSYDNVETLSQKVKQFEHEYYPYVIEQVALGNIVNNNGKVFLKNKKHFN